MAGVSIKKTITTRIFIKKDNIILATSPSSILKIVSVRPTHVFQNANVAIKKKIAKKRLIINALKKKFLKKIIFSVSIIYTFNWFIIPMSKKYPKAEI
jgi:hypothetical protein